MKYIFLVFSFITYTFLYSQSRENFVVSENLKIGLSLSGGGAKGFAHIGVLKVLDSLGVKIDYISGTSMGAIIGGLYATGYSGKEIEDIVLKTNFYEVIKSSIPRNQTSFFNKNTDKYLLQIPINKGKIVFPSSISSGQKNLLLFKQFFGKYSSTKDFSKLPIPFLCIATNIESGKAKELDSGDLSLAIIASSAYPGLLSPVKIKDSLYTDGGISLNYPSEPLKKRGMDIVIGVNLDQGLLKKEELNNIVSIISQISSFNIKKETRNQIKYTDINIHPKLDGVGVINFEIKDSTIKAGYNETLLYSEILNKLPKRNYKIHKKEKPKFSNVYKISEINVENTNIFDENYIKGKMLMKEPSLQTYSSINKKIEQLYATNNYNFINYDIIPKDDGNILNLKLDEDNNRIFLKLGLHYDEVFKSGLLTNITIKRALFRNSNTSFDLVLGEKPRYYFNYLLNNGYIPGFGLYSSYMNLELKDKDAKIYEDWNWFKNNIHIQSIWRNKFAVGIGINSDIFGRKIENKRELSRYYNPYAFMKSDTRDDTEFTTKGVLIDIRARMLDIFNDRELYKKGTQIMGKVKLNFSLGNRFTYQMSNFLGVSFGKIPEFYKYRIGGIFEQDLDNIISFYGYRIGERVNYNVGKISNNFQYRIMKNYYISANYSFANLFFDARTIQLLEFDDSSIGLSVGYRSPFGQIRISYNKAHSNQNGIFNVIFGQWF